MASATATATATAEISKEDTTVYSRAYQLEMLEESLKRNVIVAVCSSLQPLLLYYLTTHFYLDGYWERQNTCVCLKIPSEHLQLPLIAAQFGLTLFVRAVLRIKKELEVAPTGKV
jgi:hypothetical protein